MNGINSNNNQFAVVTGASQGLGKAFALELASRRVNLILVSLPGQGLAALSRQITKNHGVVCSFYETDLSIKENVIALADWINNHFPIFMLINNAGIGGTKKFLEADVDYINSIIQLNVAATSIITHQLLSNLLKQPQSYILNVSSMAAFSPIGYKTVYPASKSFIHSFSRGLCEELKHTNVFVSVVNPGAMKTNNAVIERIERQGFWGKLTVLNPEKIARYCIQQLFRRDTVIVVNPFSWLMLKILPIWIILPLMTRTVKREIAA